MQHAAFEIVQRSPADLSPSARNPRTHSKKQIRQIAASIEAFGFTNPILLDDADRIIAGHGRVAAAKLLGVATVPTIRLGQLSEAQKRAYAIADNRLAELAGWDKQLLALELRYIGELEIDFELTLPGFETAEIDLLLETDAVEAAALDRLPELRGPAVTRLGDLWRLGRHRLLCSDATDAAAYSRLMTGKQA
jgi:ParB-like chromosome segregation protein Spo0J